MKNLIILYNPYYQNDVIEQHLKLLIKNEKVAFGKIKSKLKASDSSSEIDIESSCKNIDSKNYLQLFLTDYASCYVAKVVQVTSEDVSSYAPSYYQDKSLDVEKWFLITDIREIVRDDFKNIRDEILANFTTPTFGNHTYAIYGNSYVYPLTVEMKQQKDYFDCDEDVKYYPDVFKSEQYLNIKQNLIKYSFGEKYINHLHPNSIDNIVSAEVEYGENVGNPLYDMSTVVIKYSKTIEQEIYIFAKMLFKYLMEKDNKLASIKYSVQARDYTLADILHYKPNMGTYKFILRNRNIADAIDRFCDKALKIFIAKSFVYYIDLTQDIRNETVHGDAPTREDVQKLRNKLVGIADASIIIELAKVRVKYLLK